MKESLIGKRFGQLVVKSTFKRGPYKMHLCICDCGNTTEVYNSNLRAGRTVSCGCKAKTVAHRYKKIIGKIYNNLKVVKKTDKRKDGLIVWECECLICGSHIFADRKQLLRGYVKDCGNHYYEDLIGKSAGELEVISFNKDTRKYYCKCSCGKFTFVSRNNLLSRHTLSCGHLKDNRELNYVDGTLPHLLTKKISSNNTSGVKGVSQTKNGKWVSYITLRKKRYTLGTFMKKEDAIRARKKAEEELFEPILKKQGKY